MNESAMILSVFENRWCSENRSDRMESRVRWIEMFMFCVSVLTYYDALISLFCVAAVCLTY